MKRFAIILVFFLSFFSIAHADEQLLRQANVKFFIKTMTKYNHFKYKELIAIIDQVQIQPKIIESISLPY